MCKTLPVTSFKWDNINLYTEETIDIYNENSKYDALLDIDIDYPKELHELHLGVPFLAERKVINSTSKLITSFENRNKYAVYIFALKQALNHGLILKKVYRVISFVQVAWMKTYIMKNAIL